MIRLKEFDGDLKFHRILLERTTLSDGDEGLTYYQLNEDSFYHLLNENNISQNAEDIVTATNRLLPKC